MDFSGVNNDQLLELLQACLAEATSRGIAMQRAAYDIYIDAQEVARIQAEATARALERQAELERRRIAEKAEQEAKAKVEKQLHQAEVEKLAASWRKRKAIAVALEKFGFGKVDFWEIGLWSNGADERVYFEGTTDVEARLTRWKLCLYVTGNGYNPPNTLKLETGIEYLSNNAPEHPLASKEGRAKIKAFLKAVNDRWRGLRLSSSEMADFEDNPDPKALKAYFKALGLEESANV